MSDGYLCNLVIPGAAKSGTSSLHAALTSHPQICGGTFKEPQFFSVDALYEKGPEEHNRLFDRSRNCRYYCDSSQSYFVHEHAIERIARALTAPKIILMLRHPVDRLLSHYTWNYRRGTETEPLMDAVRNRGESSDYIYDDRIGTYREVGGYLAFSRYATWVPKWLDAFGEDNVLVLKFDDFKRDQPAVIAACLAFLGLPDVAEDLSQHSNATEKTTVVVFPKVFSGLSRMTPKALKNAAAYKALRRKILMSMTPTPDATVRNDLRAHLQDILAADLRYFHDLPSALGATGKDDLSAAETGSR